jgi:diguanylate cyclase (GGDEF)-like protein
MSIPLLLSGLALAAALVVICWDRHRLAVLRRRLAEARQAATRDRLTGLANRTGFADAWCRLAPAHPWVMMVDLDGFKPVNDTHGHAAGDLVLTVIADRLRTLPGAVARLGGDEFAALLTTGDPTAVAGRLAAAIAAPVTLPSGAQVAVTASIGLAPTLGMGLPAAMAAADAAMYRAKTTRTGIAAYDPARDDHTPPTAGVRPVVRVRDLPTVDPAQVTR